MSKDIRSFFISNKKLNQNGTSHESQSTTKRKALPLSSDEEDSKFSNKSPNKQKQHKKVKSSNINSKKRRCIESDDEEIEATPQPVKINKMPSLKKLREVPNEKSIIKNIEPFLNDVPKRVERKKSSKKNEPLCETNLLGVDDEFEKSVIDIDEAKLLDKTKTNVPDIKVNGLEDEKSENKNKMNKSPSKSPKLDGKTKESGHTSVKIPLKKSPNKQEENTDNYKSPSKKSLNEVALKKSAEKRKTPSTKKQKEDKDSDFDSSVVSDEDRHEKKRLAAILYQKFKNRQSVINHGCKEIPKGKPNCLAGLSFVVTGVLESLEREEASNLIKELGGKVSTTVGKRLNYMVVGEDAGPKKLATAEELGIRIISEDGLFDLIREKSGDVKNKSPIKSSPKKELLLVKKEKKTEKSKKLCESEKMKEESPKKKIKLESPKKKPIESKEIKSELNSEISDTNIKTSKEVNNLAWVEKHKPTNIKQIIGQQGAASNVVKLKNWLSNWYSNHDGKKKLQKPNPWAKNDDGSYYKAALLSGPPGVGKTTTASLICQELGFDTVEFNASDTRSKKLLKEEVSELLSNKSLYGYFRGNNEKVSKKHVLIMDEVDGMAGNEDRGGIQELIGLIKDSSIPIICMCNDRNHQKMRSLVNYCYDLRFNRPRLEQIRGAMMSICFKEGIKLLTQKVDEIITATNHDIRQTINFLSMMNAGKELNLVENKNEIAKKDLKLGPWEVVRKVLSADEHKDMSINDRSDLFFHDYSLGPLFVQENYLKVLPRCPKDQVITQVAKTANSLSLGDLIEKRIRSNSAWTLLPVQAMFSSVLPGEYMAGRFTGQINFPGWLGKNSKTSKKSRLAQEIHNHTRIRTSGSRLSIRLDYAPFLVDAIVRPLKSYGLDGVEQALGVIKEYRLLREDLESLIELATWPGKKNPMDNIDGKVKAALTRAYNKEVLAYSYSAVSGLKKKRADLADENLEYLEGEEIDQQGDDNEEDEGNVENDALIKAKKKSTSNPSTSKAENKKTKTDGKKSASSSKGRGKK